MSLAILGIGTSVPPASITQAEATQVARFVCCRTKEQETWLPLLYDHTGIRSRHLLFDQQVIDDMMHGTSISQSVFLPTGRDDDRGPTTGQRLRQYAANAGPLALCAAARRCTSPAWPRTRSPISSRSPAPASTPPAWTTS